MPKIKYRIIGWDDLGKRKIYLKWTTSRKKAYNLMDVLHSKSLNFKKEWKYE